MNRKIKFFPAQVVQLDDVNAFVGAHASQAGLSAEKLSRVLLVLEEAFVNICSHAYPSGGGEVEIACSCSADGFVLEISDEGEPFDMLSLPDPDITLDILERPVGGLGVLLIRTQSDDVSYRRSRGRNILRMMFAQDPGRTT